MSAQILSNELSRPLAIGNTVLALPVSQSAIGVVILSVILAPTILAATNSDTLGLIGPIELFFWLGFTTARTNLHNATIHYE